MTSNYSELKTFKGPKYLSSHLQVTIREDAPKFSKLITVKAIDPENAGPVSFAISGGDEDELFQVLIKTNKIIYFESYLNA